MRMASHLQNIEGKSQSTVRYLRLAISLWVVCSGEVQFYTCQLHKLLSKNTDKDGVSVTHDGLRHAMQTPNLPLENVCRHLPIVLCREGHKMCILGQLVHHDQYALLPF